MPLSPRVVFRFLTELRFLASNAAYYLHRIRLESQRWTAAHGEARRISDLLPREAIELPQGALESQLAIAVDAQAELVAHIDAFLACLGRIALILYGQGANPPPVVRERALLLRRILGIGEDHLLAQKQLRNAWTHYDEYLDRLPEDMTSDTRFMTKAALDAETTPSALRRIAVDGRVVDFAGVGRFELDTLTQAIEELQASVGSAIASWPEPHFDLRDTDDTSPDAA